MLEPLMTMLKKDHFTKRGLEYAMIFLAGLFEGSKSNFLNFALDKRYFMKHW